MTSTSHAASLYSFQSPLVLVPLAFKKYVLRSFLLKTHKLLKQGPLHVKAVAKYASSDYKYVSLGSSCLNFRPHKTYNML